VTRHGADRHGALLMAMTDPTTSSHARIGIAAALSRQKRRIRPARLLAVISEADWRAGGRQSSRR